MKPPFFSLSFRGCGGVVSSSVWKIGPRLALHESLSLCLVIYFAHTHTHTHGIYSQPLLQLKTCTKAAPFSLQVAAEKCSRLKYDSGFYPTTTFARRKTEFYVQSTQKYVCKLVCNFRWKINKSGLFRPRNCLTVWGKVPPWHWDMYEHPKCLLFRFTEFSGISFLSESTT